MFQASLHCLCCRGYIHTRRQLRRYCLRTVYANVGPRCHPTSITMARMMKTKQIAVVKLLSCILCIVTNRNAAICAHSEREHFNGSMAQGGSHSLSPGLADLS